MSQFEYDPSKSQANLEKHGINFEDAQELWQDPDLVEIDAKAIDEPRALIIGTIGDTALSRVCYNSDCVLTHFESALGINPVLSD